MDNSSNKKQKSKPKKLKKWQKKINKLQNNTNTNNKSRIFTHDIRDNKIKLSENMIKFIKSFPQNILHFLLDEYNGFMFGGCVRNYLEGGVEGILNNLINGSDIDVFLPKLTYGERCMLTFFLEKCDKISNYVVEEVSEYELRTWKKEKKMELGEYSGIITDEDKEYIDRKVKEMNSDKRCSFDVDIIWENVNYVVKIDITFGINNNLAQTDFTVNDATINKYYDIGTREISLETVLSDIVDKKMVPVRTSYKLPNHQVYRFTKLFSKGYIPSENLIKKILTNYSPYPEHIIYAPNEIKAIEKFTKYLTDDKIYELLKWILYKTSIKIYTYYGISGYSAKIIYKCGNLTDLERFVSIVHERRPMVKMMEDLRNSNLSNSRCVKSLRKYCETDGWERFDKYESLSLHEKYERMVNPIASIVVISTQKYTISTIIKNHPFKINKCNLNEFGHLVLYIMDSFEYSFECSHLFYDIVISNHYSDEHLNNIFSKMCERKKIELLESGKLKMNNNITHLFECSYYYENIVRILKSLEKYFDINYEGCVCCTLDIFHYVSAKLDISIENWIIKSIGYTDISVYNYLLKNKINFDWICFATDVLYKYVTESNNAEIIHNIEGVVHWLCLNKLIDGSEKFKYSSSMPFIEREFKHMRSKIVCNHFYFEDIPRVWYDFMNCYYDDDHPINAYRLIKNEHINRQWIIILNQLFYFFETRIGIFLPKEIILYIGDFIIDSLHIHFRTVRGYI